MTLDELTVSVLIVNYNGATHLPNCLNALATQTVPRYRFEVIVVDNHSQDNSVEIIRSQFSWCRLVVLQRNTGFAEGNNIAAEFAHGHLLALLNNDTIPDPFWLEELLRAKAANPNDAIASKLVFAHDPGVINSTGLFLLRDGRGADRGFRQRDVGQFEARESVFMGCGAALLLDRPSDGQPLLDPRYFVYYEDLNAGWQRQLIGRGVTYAPRSLVCHVHGAAAGDQSPLFWFYVARNRALTSLRNADLFLAIWSAFVLHAKVVQAASTPHRWAVARAIVSYWRWFPWVVVERYDVRYEARR